MQDSSYTRSALSIAIAALTFAGLATTLYVNFDIISKKLGSSASLAGLFLLLIALTGTIAVFVYLLNTVHKSKRETDTRLREVEKREQDLKKREAKFKKRAEQQIESLGSIVRRMYAAYESPRYRIVEAQYEVYVEDDYSLREVKTLEIEVIGNAPLHFKESRVFADPLAAEAEDLDDINFKVEALGNHDVRCVPILNDPKEKKAAIFFLPRIKRGDGSRKIRVSYRWSKGMLGLRDEGEDTWAKTFESNESVGRAEFKFHIDKKLNPQKVAYEATQHPDMEQSRDINDKYVVFTYEISNVSTGYQDKPYKFKVVTNRATAGMDHPPPAPPDPTP